MTTFPVQVNAWERHSAVSFAGSQISESIKVEPRAYPSNPAGAADAVHAAALARRAQGQRVVIRPWVWTYLGSQPWAFYNPADRTNPDAWLYHQVPFVETVLPSVVLDWSDAFNARVIANGTAPDYLMADDENERTFFYAATEQQRRDYFEIVTIEDEANPYPNETNPFLGAQVWSYADPLTDRFIQENEQFAYDDLAAAIRRRHDGMWTTAQKLVYEAAYETRHGSLPEGGEFSALPVTNYKHVERAFQIGDVQGKPDRQPAPQSRPGYASAPVGYVNRRDLPLFAAEPEYTTTRQIANRQRWKSIIHRINDIRACAATVPGEVDPWVQAPGWGWDGGEAWCNATQLPFELILWRAVQAHYEAVGVRTYNLWNPITNDPNSATTHAFLAAYFTDRTVGPLVRDLPAIELGADTITTGGVTTAYADLFERGVIYYRREGTQTVPFLRGLGTLADPLVVSTGAVGDTEVARMVAAFTNNQGTAVTAVEVSAMAPQTFRGQYPQAPTIKTRMFQGDRFVGGGRIDPAEGGSLSGVVVRAQVRSRPRGTLLKTFTTADGSITLTPDGDGVTYLFETADTDSWPKGIVLCDVEVTTSDAGPVIVARYEIEVRETVTE